MITIDAAEELLCSRAAHRRWILRDHGDARLEQVSQEHIVEPDQGDAVV